MAVTTLPERKRAAAARIARAAATACAELRAYARERNGCCVGFGSVAEGRVRYDSDLDILIDFPAELVGEAWRFAEEVCARHAIELDLLDAATTNEATVARLRARGMELR